ncbi:MAG: hypothetical protein E6Q77_00325 [Rhizobium sp.]|nr:MAG: hypothetical protein E6Q77_00325 [Rhizobium sp.]
MAYKEMFFVQVFGLNSKKRLSLLATYPADSAERAVARASAYADRGAPGAIAFTQIIDEQAEDAMEPVLLASFGQVPPEARAAA